MQTLPSLPCVVPRPIRRTLPGFAALLACALLLAACCGRAWAGDVPVAVKPDEAALGAARGLAEEVLRRAGSGGEEGLGDWTRSVMERALERAGQRAAGMKAEDAPAPLPAERHAATVADGLPSRPNTAEVIVFASLSVPAASWREWAREAARIGAPLVLRGVNDAGLRATVKRIGERIADSRAGVAIDPRLFRLFGVGRVPAVAVVPGGVPPCATRGCSDDAPPPHDLVSGNIGLGAALEAIAAEGDTGRAAARRALARLRGEAE